MVLTQKSVGGKLEGVDPPQEGKRPCKRNSEPLQKSLRWKQYILFNRVQSLKHRLREIWGLRIVRFTTGVSSYPSMECKHLPSSGHQMPHEEEIRQLKRENDVLRQERDILKKAIGIFSRHPL